MSQPYTPTKKRLPRALIAGFTAFAATAIIGATGFAFAAPSDKPSKDQCKAAGFNNYGQCVKEWAHNKNKPGHGYGGPKKNWHCHKFKHGNHWHWLCHKHKHGKGHGHHGHGHKHGHGHD